MVIVVYMVMEVHIQVDQLTAAEARSNLRLLDLEAASAFPQSDSAIPESDSVFPESLSAIPPSMISSFLEPMAALDGDN